MRTAAASLPKPTDEARIFTSPVYFLTGRRFIHQTIFCAHSFSRQTRLAPKFLFLSDGSLSLAQARILMEKFGGSVVRFHDESDSRLADALPPARFPTLHAHRRRFVLLRKLTDTLAGASGYCVFFDSDMLFWKHPDELVTRAERSEPFYMADLGEGGYTLPAARLKQKLGIEPAPCVNSGLVAVHAEKVDWDLVERACTLLLAEGHDQRLLEQTLWAIVLAGQTARPLPAEDYRVIIDPVAWQALQSDERPVLLHYAWHARLPYVAYEWKNYLSAA